MREHSPQRPSPRSVNEMSVLVSLSGGTGSRLESAVPKPLVQIGGAPLLTNAWPALARAFEVRQVLVRAAHEYPRFVEFARNYEGVLGMPVTVSVGRTGDGPVGAMAEMLEYLGGDPVIFVAGDAYFSDPDLAAVRSFHQGHDADMTIVAARSVPTRRPSVLTVGVDACLAGAHRPDLTGADDLLNAGLYVVRQPAADWLVPAGRRWRREHPRTPMKEDSLWAAVRGDAARARVFVLATPVVNVNTGDQLRAARAAQEQQRMR